MPSPFRFLPHGHSGVVMSELFPHLSEVADELCVLRPMHTSVPNHEPGLLMMNCGNQQPIRPCLGSWASYGLGSENPKPPCVRHTVSRHAGCWPTALVEQLSAGRTSGDSTGHGGDMQVEQLIANLKHPLLTRPQQREQLDLLQALNRRHADHRQNDSILEAQIQAMELAFSMQREAQEAFDISREPQHVQEAYGDTVFGKGVLLARRLVERGVRFVQVYDVDKGKQPWDTHSENNKKHRELCRYSDQASAALITDLRQRGLLDDTLVIWGGEFGRTPYAQGKDGFNKAGRDHHHTGFSMFLAAAELAAE